MAAAAAGKSDLLFIILPFLADAPALRTRPTDYPPRLAAHNGPGRSSPPGALMDGWRIGMFPRGQSAERRLCPFRDARLWELSPPGPSVPERPPTPKTIRTSPLWMLWPGPTGE